MNIYLDDTELQKDLMGILEKGWCRIWDIRKAMDAGEDTVDYLEFWEDCGIAERRQNRYGMDEWRKADN